MNLNTQTIDDARKERGMSIHGLARESGLTYVACWRLLRGKTRNPHVNTVIKVCKAVGIDVRKVFKKHKPVRVYPVKCGATDEQADSDIQGDRDNLGRETKERNSDSDAEDRIREGDEREQV